MEYRKSRVLYRIITIGLCACVLLSLLPGFPFSLPVPEAEAVAASEANPVIFKVRGTFVSGDFRYSIIVEDVYAGVSYKSFTITYPKALTLVSPSGTDFTNYWAETKLPGPAASANDSVTYYIKGTGASRTAAQLTSDLAKITFKLTQAGIFPDTGSKVSISAFRNATAFYEDENGYAHYYEYVPFKMNNGSDNGGNSAEGKLSWFEAYNAAKAKTMQDPRYPNDPTKTLRGYLATVTSEAEQKNLYSAIADWCGWLGGTRLVFKNNAKIQDQASVQVPTGLTATALATSSDLKTYYNIGTGTGIQAGTTLTNCNEWYWACGPEAFTTYNAAGATASIPSGYKYNAKGEGTPLVFWINGIARQTGSATAATATNCRDDAPTGVYANFNNAKGTVHVFDADKILKGTTAGNQSEPNNYNSGNPGEYCLQFAYNAANYTVGGTTTSKPDTWNDFTPYPQTNSAANKSVHGYYIEWGGYPDDPKVSDLGGTGVEMATDVELVMPITVEYRSTVVTGTNSAGHNIYRPISALTVQGQTTGAKHDRLITYETHLPFTAKRNLDTSDVSATPQQTLYVGPNTIAGFEPYGFVFFGEASDEEALTLKSNGDIAGFHSIYAQRIVFLYKPHEYTLTFNANYEGWSSANVSPGNKTIYYDTPYGVLATTQRPGYNFDGWYTSAVGGTPVTAATVLQTEGDVTVYAHWSVKGGFEVHYDLNDRTDDSIPPQPDLTDPVTNNTGGAFAPKTGVSWLSTGLLPAFDPVRSGYYFMGWDVSENGSRQGVQTDDSYGSLAQNEAEPRIILQAQWASKQKIQVIYYPNGGAFEDADTLPRVILGNPDNTVSFPSIERTGFRFGGWKLIVNGKNTTAGNTFTDADDGIMYSALAEQTEAGETPKYKPYIIFEAQWEEIRYTVRYEKNDGGDLTTTPSTAYADKTGVSWEQNGLVPPEGGNPARDHYIFGGWNTLPEGGGISAFVGSPYSMLAEGDDSLGSITLYAQWLSERTYLVQYDIGEGITGSGLKPSSKTVYLNSQNLVPPGDTGNPSPPNGYTFEGWSVAANGSKAGVTGADAFGELASDPNEGFITLKAQYAPIGDLEVRYDGNGAAAPASYPNKTPVVWTQTHLLPANDPYRANYTFIGWNTGRDGSGLAVNSEHNFGDLAGGNTALTYVTLFAQWADAAKYSVHFDLSEGFQPVVPITDLELLSFADTVPYFVPRAPVGYEFDCWYVQDNGNGQTLKSITLGADGLTPYSALAYGSGTVYAKYITLKAQYKEKRNFSVGYDWNYAGAVYTGASADVKTGVSWTQANFVPYTWLDNGIPRRNPTRPGKNFTGWTLDSEGTSNYILQSTMYKNLVSGDDTISSVTLYAQWEDASFIVKYDINQGQLPLGGDSGAFADKVVGFDDDKLVPAQTLQRKGWMQNGWDVSENGSGQKNVQPSARYRDLAATGAVTITLQAQWLPKEYFVRYDTNGGNESFSQVQVNWWTQVPLPAQNPTKTGYTFAGWRLHLRESAPAPDGTDIIGQKYQDLADVNGYDSASITLLALWTPKSGYTVNYDLSYPNAPIIEPKIGVLWNDTGLVPAVSRPGFAVTSWSVLVNNTDAGISAFGASEYSVLAGGNENITEITLAANWEAKTYEVEYHPGSVVIEGTEYKAYWWSNYPVNVDFGDESGLGDKVYTIPVYTNILWDTIDYNDARDSGQKIIDADYVLIPPRRLFIDAEGYHFAGWKLIDDGTGGVTDTQMADYVIPGPNPHSFGYFAADEDVSRIVVTGTWAKSFSIFYSLAGGNYGGSEFVSPQYVDELTDGVKLKAAPVRAGFTFAGWKVVMLDGLVIADGDEFTEESHIEHFASLLGSGREYVTLEAQWVEDADITITYTANTQSGTGAAQSGDLGGDVTPATQTAGPATGSFVSIAAANRGYSFIGWWESGDTDFPAETKLSGNLEFYPPKTAEGLNEHGSYTALFREDPDVTINYEVKTLNAGGASEQTPSGSGGTVSHASEDVAPSSGVPHGSAAVAKSGYSFIGWFLSTNMLTNLSEESDFTPTKDAEFNGVHYAATYIALFQENTVAINYQSLTFGSNGIEPQSAGAGGTLSAPHEGNGSLPASTGVASGSTATPGAGYSLLGWYAYSEAGDYSGEPLNTAALFVPEKSLGLNMSALYIAVFLENADVSYLYTASAGGTVSRDNESVAPATGTALGSAAQNNNGFWFEGWYDSADILFETKLSSDAAFVPERDNLGVYPGGSFTARFIENDNVTISYETYNLNVTDRNAGGEITRESESPAPSTGAALGCTASASAGYEFCGWFVKGTNYFGTPIEDSLTFVPAKGINGIYEPAVYTAVFREGSPYTVEYNTGSAGSSFGYYLSGDGLEPGTKEYTIPNATVRWDEYPEIPPQTMYIDEPGYHFAGWRLLFDGVRTFNTEYQENISVPNTALMLKDLADNDSITKITISAVWEKSFAVLFDDNNGTITKAAHYYTARDAIVGFRSAPVRAGFEFTGWKIIAVDGEPYISEEIYPWYANTVTVDDLLGIGVNNVLLQAQWTCCIVRYDTAGGFPKLQEKRVKLSDYDIAPYILAVSKPGQRFAAWYMGDFAFENNLEVGFLAQIPDETGAIIETENGTTIITLTLTAHWEPLDRYEVRYDLNGAPGSVAPKTGLSWVSSNLLPEDPVWEGYTFTGWNVTNYGKGVNITQNDRYCGLADSDTPPYYIVITAQWTETGTFAVKYDMNGSVSKQIPDLTGLSKDSAGLIPLTNPVRPGYTFIGWDVSENGAGNDVNALDRFCDLAVSGDIQSITLQAQWAENNIYTVKYDPNFDGRFTGEVPVIPDMEDVSWLDSNLTGGVSLPNSYQFIYEGRLYKFDFIGWDVSENGFGVNITPDRTFGELASDGADNITLRASWVLEGTYNVKYDTTGADKGVPLDEKTLQELESTMLIPTADDLNRHGIKKTGYTLFGWLITDNGAIGDFLSEDMNNDDEYGKLAKDTEIIRYIVLTAIWMPREYAVYYDFDNGTAPIAAVTAAALKESDAGYDNSETAYWWSADLVRQTPFKPGFTFQGWKLIAIGEAGEAAGSKTEINGNLVSAQDEFSMLAQFGLTSTDSVFGEADEAVAYIVLQAQWAAEQGTDPWISPTPQVTPTPPEQGTDPWLSPSPQPSEQGTSEQGTDPSDHQSNPPSNPGGIAPPRTGDVSLKAWLAILIVSGISIMILFFRNRGKTVFRKP